MRTRAAVSILLLGLFTSGCSTVPERFAPNDPIAFRDFSQRPLDEVLRAHVHNGHVDYPAVRTDPRFASYLRSLAQVNPDDIPTRDERLAFWINAYNALAIQGILLGDSPLSTTGKYQFFIARKFIVGGGELNLWGLEHKLLIPLAEPRIHFAINCASLSCPPLRAGVYSAASLDRQLEHAARLFINDPTRNHFDRRNKVAQLSRIFDWYADEFERRDGSVQRYLARYVNDAALVRELSADGYRIEFLPYDWSLNGTPPR